MYKIIRGLENYGRGVPYLVVTVNQLNDQKIYLERFILIVYIDKPKEIVIMELRTTVSSKMGVSINNFCSDLAKLVEEELLLAKQHYFNWLFERTKAEPFNQRKDIVWQDGIDIVTFAFMYYRLSHENRSKINNTLINTCCKDLKEFIGNICGLGLTIE
jgi:hypothetical protein